MSIVLPKIILLPLCCLIFLASAIVESKEPAKEIVKMECVSVDWFTFFYSSQTPKSILEQEAYYDKVICRQYGYLQDLQRQIAQLKPAPEVDYLDVRTVCLLKTEGKKTLDTLSFNGFQYCQYDGKFYHLTWTLLQTIMKKLPHEQIAIIDWWLQDDPTIKAQLIANEQK